MKQVNDHVPHRAYSGVARKGHTLAEVAEAHLPPGWTDGARWLSRRLNAGKLTGYKCGRTWMMRDSDVEYMLSTLSNDAQVDNYVRQILSEAPPLTNEQRSKLADIFRSVTPCISASSEGEQV